MREKFRVHAHRGLTSQFPESTLPAFEAAIQSGVDAIEFDVRQTSDGHLVIHHDAYLGSTEDGSGILAQHTFAEVRALDAGGWFKRKFKGLKVPTLHEVLELTRGRCRLEVQIEGLSHSCVDDTLETIRELGVQDDVEITSSFPQVLCRVRESQPGLRVGVFIGNPPRWMKSDLWIHRSLEMLSFIRAQVAHVPSLLVDAETVEAFRAAGYEIHSADCNTDQQMKSAISQEVDQLSTDLALEAIYLRDGLRGFQDLGVRPMAAPPPFAKFDVKGNLL